MCLQSAVEGERVRSKGVWMHAKCETGKRGVPVGPGLLEQMCCYVWCFADMNSSFCRGKDQIFSSLRIIW